jgi:hypothetical protein
MKSKQTGICLLGLVILLSGSTSFGQIQARPKTPASRVVWHIVGRSLVNPSNGTSKVVGYVTDLDGVSGSLFKGTPSEMTAFVTLRTDVFSSQPLPPNGNVTLSIPGPVTLHLYFNPNPNNNWSEPATFSSGKEIGRFNREANLFSSIGPFSSDTFSLDLVFSQPFTINGQEVNFEKLAPDGVTNSNIGTTTSVAGSGNFTLAFPFAGCAVAIGREGAGEMSQGAEGFNPGPAQH